MDPNSRTVLFGAAGAGGAASVGFASLVSSSTTYDALNTYVDYTNAGIAADSQGNVYVGLGRNNTDGIIQAISADGTHKSRYYYSKKSGSSSTGHSLGMLSNDKLLVGMMSTSSQYCFHTTTQPSITSGSPTVAGKLFTASSGSLVGGVAVDAADNVYFNGQKQSSYDGVELHSYNSSFGSENFKTRFRSTTAGYSKSYLACDPSNSSGGCFVLYASAPSGGVSSSVYRYILKFNASGTLQTTYKSSQTWSWNTSDYFFIDDSGNWYFCNYTHPYMECTKYNSGGTRLGAGRVYLNNTDNFVACNRAEGGLYVGNRDSTKSSVYVYKFSSDLSSLEWSRRMGFHIISDTYYYGNQFGLVNAETDNEGNLIVVGASDTRSELGLTQYDNVIVKYLADGEAVGDYVVSALSDVQFTIESISNPSITGTGTYTWSTTTELDTGLTPEFTVGAHSSSYTADTAPTVNGVTY